MQILQLYSGQNINTGDYVYRIQHPATGLSTIKGVTVDNMDLLQVNSKSILIYAPLLILHHLSDPDLLPIVSERRKLGLPTIYELADNFRASQPHRPEAQQKGSPEYHIVMEELLRRCDAVQTTGQALRKRYHQLNNNFIIFPNLIDKVNVRKTHQGCTGKLTIGWGGSARHFADLANFAPAIIDWVLQHSDVRLAIMGSKKIQTLFKKLPSVQLIIQNPGNLDEYLSFLDKLDIGIAPLHETEFNACRSDVKYLEYASREVVPLCSRYGPYSELNDNGQNVLLFEDTHELIQRLEFLRTNPEKIKQIAQAARLWVEKHRSFHKKHWEYRLNIYKQLLSKNSREDKSIPKKSYHEVNSNVNKLLIQGIDTSESEESLYYLKKTVDLYSDNYQAHYFYGWTLCKSGNYPLAIKALKQALMIRPDSIRTAQLLAQIFLLSGDFKSALHSVDKALNIEPGLDTLLQLKTTILQLKKMSNT